VELEIPLKISRSATEGYMLYTSVSPSKSWYCVGHYTKGCPSCCKLSSFNFVSPQSVCMLLQVTVVKKPFCLSDHKILIGIFGWHYALKGSGGHR